MNEFIEYMIYFVRGHRVMLDADLAQLYGVATKRLNEQVRRNRDRFPEDFAFQLTQEEWENLKSQIATLNNSFTNSLRSQIATLNEKQHSKRGQYTKYLPYAFTEHGVVMLANILRSKHAVKMSIEVVRAFIRLRQALAGQQKLTKEVEDIKSFVLKHAQNTSQEFRKVWCAIEKLANPPPKEHPRIGFRLD